MIWSTFGESMFTIIKSKIMVKRRKQKVSTSIAIIFGKLNTTIKSEKSYRRLVVINRAYKNPADPHI